MNILNIIQQQDFSVVLFFTAILGLSVGSFLNVVIYRLPIMLQREWIAQAKEILGQDTAEPSDRFNLALPSSHCPHCRHTLGILENVPIISYLFLRGQCAQCKGKISIRYPLVELFCCLSSLSVVWHYGITIQACYVLLLTWGLIVLSMIDFDEQILPDQIIFPLLWLGLIGSVYAVFIEPTSAILGAALGYLALWTVAMVYQIVSGREGMGMGDCKLLSLFGAWLGWKLLPIVIVMASFVGAIVGIVMIMFFKNERHTPIPFGPYLAGAGWVCLLWGEQILVWYISLLS